MSLQNKVAIITGGATGIGRAAVERLLREGARVVINYLSSDDDAASLLAQAAPNQATLFKVDASKLADIELLVAHAVEKFGRIDIVIANAAIMPMIEFANVTEQDWTRVVDLNAKGPLFLVQRALPYMAEGARVIFLSTTLTAASTVMPGYLLYLASKGAIEQMTRVLAKDLGRRGITVNAVSPGPTSTALFLEGKTREQLAMISHFNPFGKIGSPEEIADVIAFVASPDARWVSGQVIRVNGAMA